MTTIAVTGRDMHQRIMELLSMASKENTVEFPGMKVQTVCFAAKQGDIGEPEI